MQITKLAIKVADNKNIYFARLKKGNDFYWHFLRVDKIKEKLLQKASGEVDLKEFGEILDSGYGAIVPDAMKKKYEM